MPAGESFYRGVEIVFTSYAVPALLLPLVWLLGRLTESFRHRPAEIGAEKLLGLERAYAAVAAALLLTWLGVKLGIRFESLGPPAVILIAAAYATLNLVLAQIFLRLPPGFGRLAEGQAKDRVFARFILIVLFQPLITGCAFGILYRVIGVVYHRQIPAGPAVQEGI